MKLFNFDLVFHKEVYQPREDSLVLAENLKKEVRPGDEVLDVGTGSGILAPVASKKAKYVMGTDINPEAVERKIVLKAYILLVYNYTL